MCPRTSERGRSRDRGWPAVATVLGGLLLVFYAIPLALVLVRAPGALDARGAVADAAITSVTTAAASTAVATVLGVPLAYRLARARFRGKRAVTGLVALPLVLPPVVSGLLLLSAVGPSGLGGLVGVRVAGTHAGVVLAQTFVASPFVVVVGQAAFEGVDPQLEAASRTLGVGRFGTFRRVALPLAARGVLAGVTLAFARAMGEFGATLLLAYYPRTLPVEIWVAFQARGVEAALPVAVVLLAVAAGALAVLGALGRGTLAPGAGAGARAESDSDTR